MEKGLKGASMMSRRPVRGCGHSPGVGGFGLGWYTGGRDEQIGTEVLGVKLAGPGLDVRAEGHKFRVISRCLV